jgi:hypothetical protein
VPEEEKYISPYFCFIQSSGMGKTKLMYEFAKLTRMTSPNADEGPSNVSEEFSCDLILSGDILIEKNVPESDVFDCKLDLRRFVLDPNKEASTVANNIYDHLEEELVTKRSTCRPMKKTHVFLFVDAQVFLDAHYGFEAFVFRCIRTWLRTKRDGTTTIAVFSGTSSSILNYSVLTDLLEDNMLEKVSPSRDPYNDERFYPRGFKTFEPFFTLTTIAVLNPKEDIPNQSDYNKSILYGRPLFAKMHQQGQLEPNIETILKRLLLYTGEEGFAWSKKNESWLSVLATRVQMGSTTVNVVSRLVAKGYANLTGVAGNSATFVCMPDPVCARLAMCMMDENWRLGSFKGKSKKWWSKAVGTIYATGLCLPDKGDVGEVLTALYLLFCCDECRRSMDNNFDYKTFSVPLGDWIDAIIEKRSSSEAKNLPASQVRVSFIQVCRDYMRAPWIGLADQVFLENLYNAGTAFYTYPGCDLIDFVAPTVITTGNTKPTYSAVLVSIKSRLYLGPRDAKRLCAQMKRKANACKLKSALCIVCVFGQEAVSNYGQYNFDSSMLRELEEGKNVATVLRLPRYDRFGLTDIFLEIPPKVDRLDVAGGLTPGLSEPGN